MAKHDEIMEMHYALTEKDYIRFNRIMTASNKSQRLIMTVLFVLLGVFYLAVLNHVVAGILLLLCACVSYFLPVFTGLFSVFSFRQSTILKRHQLVRFYADRIETRNYSDGVSEVLTHNIFYFDDMEKVLEDKKCYYFCISAMEAVVMPKGECTLEQLFRIAQLVSETFHTKKNAG